MSELFDRKLIVKLRAVERNQSGVVQRAGDDITIWESKIDFSITKDGTRELNTGNFSIINIDRFLSRSVFANVKRRRNILYSVQGGYHQSNKIEVLEQELPFISIGYVSNTNWSHTGGDTILTFNVQEGINLAVNVLDSPDLGLRTAAKGQTIANLLTTIENEYKNIGVTIEYRPNKRHILNNLKNYPFNQDYIFKNPKADIGDFLSNTGLDFYLENNKYIIYETNNRFGFITGDRGRVSSLSFDTGLLSADVEVSHNPRVGFIHPLLKFKTLFIPEIIPWAVIRVDEPAYDELKGDYRVLNVSYNLTNKSGGDFSVTGVALHREFIRGEQRLSSQEDAIIQSLRRTR